MSATYAVDRRQVARRRSDWRSVKVFLIAAGYIVVSGAMWNLGVRHGARLENADKASNRYKYTDVLILEAYSSDSYKVQPINKPFKMRTCTPQNWKKGEMMEVLHFEWTPLCDKVDANGAFRFYYDEVGNRRLFPIMEEVNVRR